MQAEQHERRLVAQGYCRQRQGEISDHLLTVSFDVSAAHGAVRFETGEKPQHGQNSEAQMGRETLFRYQSHGEAGD